ncbi:MAG: ATP-binding protein [Acidobacteriota bacterium]|nr:ATP-binding protein [Acidobacteriota bacterium]MDH3525560.1 ATP-binding protein [Acidobacteriota bacterium]
MATTRRRAVPRPTPEAPVTPGLAFFLLAVALVVAVVVHQSLSQRQRRQEDHESRLELLASISTLEEVQKELFRRKTLAAMGELAGSVGHDLRSPLAVIRNSTHLLQNLGAEPEGKAAEYLALIDKQVERADKIISNLLDFSRTATTEPALVDLEEFFASLLAEFPVPPGIEIRHHPGPAATLRIDPSQLRQVVVNIMNNAVQAIGASGTIDIESRSAGGRTILAISNSGPPIQHHAIKKIFDPLFSTRPGGVGLGLAIVKNLVEANGGEIAVETGEAGSTFRLEFASAGPGAGGAVDG